MVFDHKVSQWRAEHFVPDRNEIAPVYRFRDKRHPRRADQMPQAGRRGKRVAVVALARKLAGILYAMMRDETEFEDKRWTTRRQGV